MRHWVFARKNELLRLIKKFEKQLAEAPEGRVYLRKKGKCISMNLVNGGKKKGAPIKNRYVSLKCDEAPSIATKYYLHKLIPVLKKEFAALDEFEKTYNPQEKYDLLSEIPAEVASLINNPMLPWKERAAIWEQSPFQHNPLPIESPSEYKTRKGERVRSRAEIIIGNELHSLGFPYRYESVYFIGSKKYYPDFTVMHPQNGKKYYIEYFGLMSDENYRQNAFSKIREYNKSKDANNFIYLFEDNTLPLDTVEINNLLLRKLGLPNSSPESLLS